MTLCSSKFVKIVGFTLSVLNTNERPKNNNNNKKDTRKLPEGLDIYLLPCGAGIKSVCMYSNSPNCTN